MPFSFVEPEGEKSSRKIDAVVALSLAALDATRRPEAKPLHISVPRGWIPTPADRGLTYAGRIAAQRAALARAEIALAERIDVPTYDPHSRPFY